MGANLSFKEDGMVSWLASEDHRITLLPLFDHKERADDDCGLPEHPIFSNYPKYLWKTHTRSGGVQSPNASVENTDRVEPRPV